MSDTVEVLATARVAAADLDDIGRQLDQWGLRSSTRRMPARRGIAEISWLVLLVVPAELMVRSMVERLGEDAYQALRGVVERVIARHRGGSDRDEPDGAVVVESADTGVRFRLEPDLPLEAYRHLFAEIRDPGADDGLRVFDRERRRWCPHGVVMTRQEP